MAYNLTDEELMVLSNEQLLELSDANIRMSRRLDAEMLRRGLVLPAPYRAPLNLSDDDSEAEAEASERLAQFADRTDVYGIANPEVD